MQLRTRALETILIEKGYIEPAALDELIETYEKKIGPRNGAQVVAKAWADPEFRQWLLEDGTAAIGSLGFGGRSGNHLVALENTPAVHNMVVCTLCSCYPWAVLGLPPLWYKSAPYRSRAVADPRGVLREFGVELPKNTEIRVWDSTAELRYMVRADAPRRHRRLERGQARRSGHARQHDRHRACRAGRRSCHERRGRHGRHARLRSGRAGAGRAGLPCRLGEEGLRAQYGHRRRQYLDIDAFRFARESLPPPQYLNLSYYGLWVARTENMLLEYGVATPKPSSNAGHALAPVEESATRGHRRRRAPTWCAAARLTTGRRRRRHGSRPATKCAPRTCIRTTHTRLPRYARGHTGDDRAHRRLPRVSRQQRDQRAAKTRIGSTPCVSTAANCGARTATRRSGSASRPGSLIWSRCNCRHRACPGGPA